MDSSLCTKQPFCIQSDLCMKQQ